MKNFFVLCVISLYVSVVFNQDIKKTSINIHSSVGEESDEDESDSNSNIILSNYIEYEKYVTSVATAIADVINELFIKQNIHFDILIFDYLEKDTVDAIGEIRRILSDNYATMIKMILRNKSEIVEISQSALILTDVENVEAFNNWVKLTNVFPKKLKFLIYTFKSGNLFDAPTFLARFGHISQFEYFLADKNDEELELTTFEWFTDEKCNFKTYEVLNTFNTKSQEWDEILENHEKFKNFYNCMIHVGAFQGVYEKKFDSRKQSLAYDIMDIAAQMKNFTLVRGDHTANINTKIHDEEHEVHVDHNVAMDAHFFTEYKNYHFTKSFAEDSIIFMITPGELYTSYEKILMPYDELTWYFLIATFAVAFGVIFVVNLMPRYIQDYFYGERVSMPAFNVIGTFFGIGQLRLPTANFPRMILMIFILFCLIIRTAYQGVMFEMMTKEMRKSSPKTIDDLFERNFSVNLLTINSNFIPISRMFFENIDEQRQNMTKKYDYTEMLYNLCSFIFNPERKFAVNTDKNLFKMMTNYCNKPPMLLNEEFMNIPAGIAMDKNNFFYEAIEEVMHLTIPFGIPQYWGKHHRWYQHERNSYTEIEKIGAQILRMNDLSFGFIIWLIACGVAVCGFLCEIVAFAINKLKRLTKVEPIEINNTNILLPKKLIKPKKAKKLRELVKQKSTLDVKVLLKIQNETLSKIKVVMPASQTSTHQLVTEHRTQPTRNPASQTSTLSPSQPASHPISQPIIQRTSQPISHLGINPFNQNQPSSKTGQIIVKSQLLEGKMR